VCNDPGTQRVVVTAAEASSWALRPALLEEVDRDLGNEGASTAVGLMFCADHAAGVEREHFRARSARLTTNETRLVKHLQAHAQLGGDTVEGIAARLRLSESSVRTMIRRLRDVHVITRSRYQGVDRAKHRVPKWLAVSEHQEPPPVQTGLELGEEGHTNA
jgi:hypothetical protein